MKADLGLRIILKEMFRAILSDERVLDKTSRASGITRLVKECAQFKNLKEVVDVFEDWVHNEVEKYMDRIKMERALYRHVLKGYGSVEIRKEYASITEISTSKKRETEVKEIKVEGCGRKRRILMVAASLAIAIVLALAAIALLYP